MGWGGVGSNVTRGACRTICIIPTRLPRHTAVRRLCIKARPFLLRAWAWPGAASKTLARRPCQQHWCPRHTFHCNLAVLASSVDLARRSLENAGAETSKCADTHCVLHLGHTAGRQANVRMLIVFCIHEGCRKTHFLLHFPIRGALCRSSAVALAELCRKPAGTLRQLQELDRSTAQIGASRSKS